MVPNNAFFVCLAIYIRKIRYSAMTMRLAMTMKTRIRSLDREWMTWSSHCNSSDCSESKTKPDILTIGCVGWSILHSP